MEDMTAPKHLDLDFCYWYVHSSKKGFEDLSSFSTSAWMTSDLDSVEACREIKEIPSMQLCNDAETRGSVDHWL